MTRGRDSMRGRGFGRARGLRAPLAVGLAAMLALVGCLGIADGDAAKRGHSAAAMQKVVIPNGQLQLKGVMTRPAGNGPFAAVVLLPGCSRKPQPESHVKGWLQTLARKGFVTVAVDSAGSRHRCPAAADQASDAFAALTFLRGLDYVDQPAVGVIGWSGGATGALTALAENGTVAPPSGGGFAAGVAFYPGCAFKTYRPTVPVRVFSAQVDPHTKACRLRSREGGARFILSVFRGARPSFDEARVPRGRFTRQDVAARKRADRVGLAALRLELMHKPDSPGSTVLQAEAMKWPANAGRAYSGDGQANAAGFAVAQTATGEGAATITRPLTGISARLRATQSGLCSGQPQLVVTVDGQPQLQQTIAPSSDYRTVTSDADVAAGNHLVNVGLTGGDLPTCKRELLIDNVTLVASRVFAADSWRNRRLRADAPLEPTGQQLADNLRSQIAQFGTWVNTTEFSSPVYVVPANQPAVTVQVDPKENPWPPADTDYLNADLAAVPIPADGYPAGPAEGPNVQYSDHEMIVYQPATDTAWELYHLVKRDGRWYVTDGGKISHVAESKGYFDPWPDKKVHGMTASGLPLLGGIQTIAELQAGSIDHALVVAVPHARKGVVRRPAIRTDGDFTVPDAVPEGTRFRLPATLNIDDLPMTSYGKMVARAIQRYGLVVNDKDCRPTDKDPCPAVTFAAEDPRPSPDGSHANPYDGIFGRIPPSRLLDGFPWDKLQVLAED